MDRWKVDVAVLLIFFKRDVQFKQTFEAVKKAKPKILLLWQDGPRQESDMPGILACREIAERIDWDCDVYRKYNTKNYGCDPSTYYSHKWAFSIVDKCIVLEDDFVANESFFLFCKTLLDKYEHDTRINHICGMNMLGKYEDYPYDYFFGYTGTNAWASWRRVVDGWDGSYAFLHEDNVLRNLRSQYGRKLNQWIKVAKQRESTGVPYWESILLFDSLMNSRLAIVTSKNMVENIGMTEDSTHSKTNEKYLTKTEKKVFHLETYEMQFPLKHPPYIVCETEYYRQLDRFFGNGHFLIRMYRKGYHCFKYLIYGDLLKKLRKKIHPC